jgi:hypothetical protein
MVETFAAVGLGPVRRELNASEQSTGIDDNSFKQFVVY